MTPMIDVTFLLIIFFLCIDFKTLEAKLPAYLPKDRGSSSKADVPIEQLSIRIVNDVWGREVPRHPDRPVGAPNSFRLEGHACHWEVGPTRFDALADLEVELRDIVADPMRRVPDSEVVGRTKIVPVVIEPGVGVTYGDVAQLVDSVQAAGFDDIGFGGGLGRRRN